MLQFRSESPESVGVDPQKLEQYASRLAGLSTKALIVMRRDAVVKQWFADGFSPDTQHYTASLAKTIVGGLAIAVAVSEGLMAYDDPACKYIPAWRDDPVRSRITIRQLATHTSGLANASHHADGWERMFWQRDPSPSALDPFTCSLFHAPVLHSPGTKVLYSNPGIAALAYAITASLQGTPHPDIHSLLREKIMRPLGIPDEAWSIGYDKPIRLDGMSLYATWGGGMFTPAAVLQLGRLLMRKGQWEGQTLIRPQAIRPMLAGSYRTVLPDDFPHGPMPAPSVGGFVNHYNVYRSVPDCTFIGAGAGHQLLIVIPSLELIVVRMGNLMFPGDSTDGGFWRGLEPLVFTPLVGMLQHRSPFPPSDKVRRVTFAPPENIRISGEDSDNWPCTWGADDTLYTAYGDGYGFKPHTEKKLSLGFAVLHGTPDSFVGVNLRTETGEREGDGAQGVKASGLLMVDGVLYMLVRNAGNSQLAWSEDGGATWEWGFKFETSFGCPTFANAGRNYEGAPDDYVYIYSPDGDSAYEEYDRIVLARVHRDRIRSRDDYEFFRGLDDAGVPVWTRRIEERGGVFEFPQNCHRLEALYHAATRRFWLVLACNHEGGWGIFDSPTPYGPWSTVYYTEYWGLGRTHAYRIPVKWISEDGNRLALVFSGRRFGEIDYDACCVRAMTLEPAGEADGEDGSAGS